MGWKNGPVAKWSCNTKLASALWKPPQTLITPFLSLALSATVYPYLGDSTVTKMCAPRCVPSDVDGIGITRPVTCCNTDLCNSDGAASLQASSVVVGLTTTALCMLLRTGLSWSPVGEELWP